MSKQIEALAQKLKEAGFAYHLLDNGVLLVPRVKAMNDHGFEKEQFLVTTLYEKEGTWGIIIQAKLRKIDESNPLWSLENAKTVMEAIKGMMEQQYPCIDKDGNIPLEWSVDYDFENLIGEEKSRAAVVEAEVGVTTGVDDIYELLLQLPKISEVELQLEHA